MAEYIYRAEPIGEGQYHHILIGELVRCGECVYWEQATANSGRCNRALEITAYATDYCSYGERRADDDEK